MAEKKEKYWSRYGETHDIDTEYVVGINTICSIKKRLSQETNLGDVVEFGCGRGFYTKIIAQEAEHVTATDLSWEMLEYAKRELADFKNVKTQRADCKNTPFKPDSFDTVFIANTIHAIRNPLLVLKESSRVLKRAGILLIVTYTAYGIETIERLKLYRRFYKKFGIPPRYVRDFSKTHLEALVEKAGFRVEISELLKGETNALFLRGRNNK